MISTLINSGGRVVWRCMPRFDGAPASRAQFGSSSAGGDDGPFIIELESLDRT